MSMPDDDLAGLSDEERAALEDDSDESEALAKIAGDDGADEDDEGGEGAAADDAGDPAGAAADGEPAAGAADDQAGDPAPTPVADEFRHEFKADAPEGVAEKIAAIDAQTTDLVRQFQDGEIDMAGFMAEKSRLDNERVTLVVAAEQAKFAERQNTESREQRWKWEQERFFGAERNAETYKDPIVLAALDAQIKQLANDAKNSTRAAGWFLEEADRLVRARFRLGDEPAAPTPTPAAKNRQPDLKAVPKTLANLPAAELADTGGDEFAYLDKLDGIALESALRKLTPEQEARYLGAAA